MENNRCSTCVHAGVDIEIYEWSRCELLSVDGETHDPHRRAYAEFEDEKYSLADFRVSRTFGCVHWQGKLP